MDRARFEIWIELAPENKAFEDESEECFRPHDDKVLDIGREIRLKRKISYGDGPWLVEHRNPVLTSFNLHTLSSNPLPTILCTYRLIRVLLGDESFIADVSTTLLIYSN